jgi:hypothetical protein
MKGRKKSLFVRMVVKLGIFYTFCEIKVVIILFFFVFLEKNKLVRRVH